MRPEAGVRVWLLAPRFRPESLAAARAAGAIALASYRCLRNGGQQSDVLLEALPDGGEGKAPAPSASLRPPAQFRSGLDDADLGLTAEERREFD
jgi:hypothetical protein